MKTEKELLDDCVRSYERIKAASGLWVARGIDRAANDRCFAELETARQEHEQAKAALNAFNTTR